MVGIDGSKKVVVVKYNGQIIDFHQLWNFHISHLKLKMKLTLSIFSSSILANEIQEPCPEIPNQPNFDAARYLGQWET